MTILRRARQETQKQERRQAILDTALQLFASSTYQEMTLEMVAQHVGVARGTIYLYFKTREELFLVAFSDLFQSWLDEVDTELQRIRQIEDEQSRIDEVARLIPASLEQRKTMVRLSSVVHTILEHNIDAARARQFKKEMLTRAQQTAHLLEQCLPFLDPGQGLQLLLYIDTLVIGLSQQTDPAPVLQQILAEPDMRPLLMQFQPTFSHLFRILLYGLEQEKRRKT